MSLIHEFRQTEEAIKELQARLSEIEGNEKFQREREFEQELRMLLASHGKSLRDVIEIIDPTPSASRVSTDTTGRKATRQKRRLKTFNNPHTGEVIQTRGGNHNQLKEWKAKYGADQVESWAS